MRLLILLALFLTLASASYANKNRFNRLLRNLQQQQQNQEGLLGYRGEHYADFEEQDEDQDREDNIYRQQQCQQRRGQRQRPSIFGSNEEDQEQENDDYQQQCQQRREQRPWISGADEDENDQDQDQDEDNYQHQGERHIRRQQSQGQRQQTQQRRHQQQQHQCQPKFRLLQDIEQSNAQLASKLYKQAKQENDDKNTVVSPTAIQLALAALQRGARGQTRRQLQRLTGAGLNQQQNQQAHAALQESLRGQDPLQLQTGQNQRAKIKTTTAIVINQRNHAQQQFIQAIKACANAQVKKCNFQHQPQQCRQQINQYLAQKTNQKLRHVVPQGAITQNTKLVVVSTTQIEAKWGRQFRNQQQTKQGRFYPLGNQQPKHVQVLQSQGQFNYYEDEQVQVVGVPTQNQELTFYAIVPKDKDGLNQVEKQQIQNSQQLQQLLNNADQQQEEVHVELPKFQIKHKIDAKQTLRKEGVQNVFDADEADLSGITGQQQQQQQQQQRRRRQQQYSEEGEDQDQGYEQSQGQGQQLHVNKLIHQATIKINEQGITAARSGYQNQNQYQDQDQDNDQSDENEENDEVQQRYHQQQYRHQELYDEIFGQQQRRRQRRGQYKNQEQVKVKANRAFAFAIKHNPSNQIVLVGRVIDATQKPNQQQQGQQQTLNGVDQQ